MDFTDLRIGPGDSREMMDAPELSTRHFDKQSTDSLLRNHPSSGKNKLEPERKSRSSNKPVPPSKPRPLAPGRRSSLKAQALFKKRHEKAGGKRKRRRKTRRKSRKRKRKTRRKRKLRRKRKTRRKR